MNLSSSRMIQHSLPRRLLHNHSGVVSIALFFVFCCVVFSLITSNFLSPAPTGSTLSVRAPRC
ncbi:hypothetical protein QE409_001043 [Klebsiella sp. SORGH_AS 1173]|nr:hypothetical protein [Klebsiella sp. SORGH_AS_1173]